MNAPATKPPAAKAASDRWIRSRRRDASKPSKYTEEQDKDGAGSEGEAKERAGDEAEEKREDEAEDHHKDEAEEKSEDEAVGKEAENGKVIRS